MEQKKALEIVKEQLTERRYQHTLGVLTSAIELARRFNCNQEKAAIAAIFHDYAKFRPVEEMEEIISHHDFPQDLLLYNPELWHAPVGAYLVQKEVGITDSDILLAIRFHTSGRVDMTLLEKIIYVADYIEPGRHFPGVETVRDIATKDLDAALIQALSNSILYLLEQRQTIYPDTLHTYNDLVFKREAHNK